MYASLEFEVKNNTIYISILSNEILRYVSNEMCTIFFSYKENCKTLMKEIKQYFHSHFMSSFEPRRGNK